ncbi:MAG: NAD(P)-binding domain-containing protein [Paludibacteraceae bacterium]|nr:NAD(P)-binding domain-containing protein [Paludibacteraceae bacterium]
MKIAFTTSLPREGFARLQHHELDVPLEEAEVLVTAFNFAITRDNLSRFPHLKLVANYAVGYNNVDVEACRERGIVVTNTPLPVLEPTAEHAFALMHAAARRVAELDRTIRDHTAEPMAIMNNLGNTLYGKRLGIIGLGRIGQALARRAFASGMEIVYHNRKPLDTSHLPVRTDLPQSLQDLQTQAVRSAQYLSLDELLATSDFVSLNLPYSAEVHHLIGTSQLQMMKPSAFLINTARGAHIDVPALAQALRQHTIAGAALDVYENEPEIPAELLSLNNIILAPHVGTGTWETRLAMCENVTDNILYFEKQQFNLMNIVS